MTFASYRTNFTGALRNIKVEFIKELDYEILNLKDRKNFLNEKYKKVEPFYNTYIYGDGDKKYYKVNLNTSDELSSEINIFKSLEADGTYLLNSLDHVKKPRHEKYTMLNEKDFKKHIMKEVSLNTLISENDTTVILNTKKNNDYINLEHKIKKEDLHHYACGSVISQYKHYRELLMCEMAKCKDGNGNVSLYKLRSLLGGINDDMILSKIQLRGIKNPAKKLGDIGSQPDFNLIDYTNEEHIKNIIRNIRFGEISPTSELSHIIYDIEVALRELYKNKKLNNTDMEIVECYNSGYTLQAIGDELGMKKQSVLDRLKKIFKKVSNFYLTKVQKNHNI